MILYLTRSPSSLSLSPQLTIHRSTTVQLHPLLLHAMVLDESADRLGAASLSRCPPAWLHGDGAWAMGCLPKAPADSLVVVCSVRVHVH